VNLLVFRSLLFDVESEWRQSKSSTISTEPTSISRDQERGACCSDPLPLWLLDFFARFFGFLDGVDEDVVVAVSLPQSWLFCIFVVSCLLCVVMSSALAGLLRTS